MSTGLSSNKGALSEEQLALVQGGLVLGPCLALIFVSPKSLFGSGPAALNGFSGLKMNVALSTLLFAGFAVARASEYFIGSNPTALSLEQLAHTVGFLCSLTAVLVCNAYLKYMSKHNRVFAIVRRLLVLFYPTILAPPSMVVPQYRFAASLVGVTVAVAAFVTSLTQSHIPRLYFSVMMGGFIGRGILASGLYLGPALNIQLAEFVCQMLVLGYAPRVAANLANCAFVDGKMAKLAKTQQIATAAVDSPHHTNADEGDAVRLARPVLF